MVFPAHAFVGPAVPPFPNFDQRRPSASNSVAVAARHRAAAELRRRQNEIEVSFDPITQSPRHVFARRQFVTGAGGNGGGILAAAPERDRSLRLFLDTHREIFGYGAEELTAARLQREFVTAHNGLRTVVWEQQWAGRPVFGGRLIAHSLGHGELVSIASGFATVGAGGAGGGNAAAAQGPELTAVEAVVIAARNVEVALDAAEVVSGQQANDGRQLFRAPGLSGVAARQVWLPMGPETMRLCWEVILTSTARSEMYQLLVAADGGEVLLRRCLTDYISAASYRVFTSDSPTLLSPGHATPLPNQPSLLARELIVTPALNLEASPLGWIDDGGNETRGNNVDAHLDRDSNDIADLPQTVGSPLRVFDFPWDAAQPVANFGDASVVQLFYWNNWMHDRLYELGFTEEAGNFQKDNLGRGGLGLDAVEAEAQNGGGTDNANFSTPPDGLPPRMQMFLWTAPEPDRDASFDAEVVLHEYTHGLSQRLVGGGAGMNEVQAKGMGEGWSDFYALALLSQPEDDQGGNYAFGAYVAYRPANPQNYYFGLRRYPYTTDLSRNPLTFRDIDPVLGSSHPGVPRNPIVPTSANEVHNMGEVWAVTLWEARAQFIARYGFAAGNRRILQLVTDALRLTPPDPTFLEARDAILLADRINHQGEDLDDLWAAFAKRGMGFSARAPASSTTSGVLEAFDLPDDLRIVPVDGFVFDGRAGGPFSPGSAVFFLTNLGTSALRWTASTEAGWLSLSSAGGVLGVGAWTPLVVAPNSAARLLPAGVFGAGVALSNLTKGVGFQRVVTLRVDQPQYFVELFDKADNDLDFQTFTFTPDGSSSYYSVCRTPASSFPTDPAGGIGLALTDESFFQFAISGGQEVSIYGHGSNVFSIVSNGYLTLGVADLNRIETLAAHFRQPRVAGLFDDLNPAAGSVSWKQLADRIAVTFRDVPEFLTVNSNSFQMELFFDGRIRLTYLQIDARDGLIGISPGGEVPAGFVETDFSALEDCTTLLALTIPSDVTEGAGVLRGQGRVRLPVAAGSNVVVSLSSDDLSEVLVPSNVVIRAGDLEASFDLTVVDDQLLDGAQRAIITATAPGFQNVTASLRVADNERGTLRINVPSLAIEGENGWQGSVSVTAPVADNVLVELSSSDGSMVLLPPFVIIPAGGTTVGFIFDLPEDSAITGWRSAVVTARVENWFSDQDLIFVQDNESTNLTVTLPALVREGAGILRNSATVRIQGTLGTNLTVALLSDSPGKVTVPPSITIPAGETSVTFDLILPGDDLLDGMRKVVIRAVAPGFFPGEAAIDVSDDETPPAPFTPTPADLASNVAANSTLSWRIVEMGPVRATTFDVYLGTHVTLGPSNLIGTTTAMSLSPGMLAPATTYYWQIVARRAGQSAGPVWSFRTRGVDHFTWSAVPSPQRLGEPFHLTITARDDFGSVVKNFASDVMLTAARQLSSPTAGVLITEVQNGDPDFVEFANASAQPRSIGGWTITIYDDQAWPEPTVTFTVPAGTVCQPGEVFRLRELGQPPGIYPSFTSGTNVHWTYSLTNNPIAVLLRDGSGAVKDFFCAGSAQPAWIANPVPIPVAAWRLPPLPVNTDTTLDYQRVGSADRNDASDWALNAPSAGLPNSGLTLPFPDSEPIPITPTIARRFVSGTWIGKITAFARGDIVRLEAKGETKSGSSNPFTIQLENDLSVMAAGAPDPVAVGASATFTATVRNEGSTPSTAVVITNILSDNAPISAVEISRGSCTRSGQQVVCQVGSLAGRETVTLSVRCATGAPGVMRSEVTVGRQEPEVYAEDNRAVALIEARRPVLSVDDASVLEGDGGTSTLLFHVRSSLPAGEQVTARYVTSNRTAQAGIDYQSVTGQVTFAVGESNQTIAVQVNGDIFFELDETFAVTLFEPDRCLLGRSVGIGTIRNDEPIPAVSIDDVEVVEGNTGVSLAVFTIQIHPPSSRVITIGFTTADGSATAGTDYLPRWGSWTFQPGETVTNLSVAILGDRLVESNETFLVKFTNTVSVVPAGGPATGTIASDDGLPGQLDHFTWDSVPSPQSVNRPFQMSVRAEDPNNELVPGFSGGFDLLAQRSRREPVRILSFLRYADTNVSGEYGSTLRALSGHFTNFVETATTTTNAETLRTELESKEIFLVVEQENSFSGQMASLGTAWAAVLSNFVYQGGIAIVCSFERDEHLLLVNSGLLSLSKRGTANVAMISGTDHFLTAGITFPFVADFVASYSGSNGISVLQANGAAIVLAREVGAGQAILIGTDFFRTDSEFARVLANAVQRAEPARIVPVAFRASPGPQFTNGIWTGEITVEQPEDAMYVVATNQNGRFGESHPFAVRLHDDLELRMTPSNEQTAVGGPLVFTLVASNSGPTAATGVNVTNFLPVGIEVLAIESSQGICARDGAVVSCALGTLAADSAAVIRIALTRQTVGGVTNRALATRAEPDTYTTNNEAVASSMMVQPWLTIENAAVVEGNEEVTNASFRVRLSVPAGRPVTVSYSTCSITASASTDYNRTDGVLLFAQGESEKFIAVPVRGDLVYETAETFCVTLFSPTNALLSVSQATGTILNDDPLPRLFVNNGHIIEGDSGLRLAMFDVRLLPPSSQTARVDYYTAPLTAQTNDFAMTNGTLRFFPGVTTQSFAVILRGDTEIEPDEVFTVNLQFPANAILGNATGLGTIFNDDAEAGTVDHFTWNPIDPEQYVGLPVGVTVSARDIDEQLVANFAGPVNLSGLAEGLRRDLLRDGFEDGRFDGRSDVNLNWHVDGGPYVRLVSNEAAAVGGRSLMLGGGTNGLSDGMSLSFEMLPDWLTFYVRKTGTAGGTVNFVAGETEPVVWFVMQGDGYMGLRGGKGGWMVLYQPDRWYKIAVSFNWRLHEVDFHVDDQLMEANVPFYGAPAGYLGSIQLFHTGAAQSFWDDIALEEKPPLMIPVSPAATGRFQNGQWTGQLLVTTPATNLMFRADDGTGLVGMSNPIRIAGAGPNLTARQLPGRVVLSWPAAPAGFVLQSNPNVGNPAGWSTVPGTPAVLQGNNFVTNNLGAGNRFYRLRRSQ